MPVTIISVGIHKRLLPDYFPNWETVKSAWTFIAERFDKFISTTSMESPDKGIIVVDKSSRSIHEEVVGIINRLREFGSNTQEINNIVEEPLFISSAVSEQMQIADASAYCTMKYLNDKSVFSPYFSSGDPRGYGFKVFP